MKGARKYAELFKVSGQDGKLVWVVGSHARGKTFKLFILPEGEKAEWIGGFTASDPLNSDKVEVYGVIGGNPGWSEEYGWLHEGPWQADFTSLCFQKEDERAAELARQQDAINEEARKEQERIQSLLDAY